MGAAFHSGHKEKDLYKCPMCNTVFKSKTPICPTCGIDVKNLPVQTPPTTPVQTLPTTPVQAPQTLSGGDTIRVILVVLLIGFTLYWAFSDFSLSFFESGVPDIGDILAPAPIIKEDFKIGNSLSSFYEKVREVNIPSSKKERVQLGARLALHDMGRLNFGGIGDEYTDRIGEESYNQAFEYLDKAYRYCNIYSNDDATTKIEKILKFVTDNVVYELEFDDLQRSPIETLSLGSGDCDDFSVLAGALFEGAGIESALGSFTSGDSGHAMVLVHLPKLNGTTSWGFDDLTQYGLKPGRWILLEPQTTLEYQNTERIGRYDLVEAIEIDFEHATS